MQILTTRRDLLEYIAKYTGKGSSLGFVPTMGSLHQGHVQLVRQAQGENKVVLVSIFVNPLQFNNQRDLELYPRTIESDSNLLTSLGVNALFVPSSVDELFPVGSQTRVKPGKLAELYEGAARPGHFEGVATVVAILLNLTQAKCAYFGEKDYQQLRIVEQLAVDLAINTKIIRVATVRESDGLALSSRNARLSIQARQSALSISMGLFAAQDLFVAGERNAKNLHEVVLQHLHQHSELNVGYVAVVDDLTLDPIDRIDKSARILVACEVGGVRLIDNVKVAK